MPILTLTEEGASESQMKERRLRKRKLMSEWGLRERV